MNIWLVQIGEPLPLKPDVRLLRTGILAEVLAERGHDVLWWVSAFEHQSKRMLLERDQTVTVGERIRMLALKGCGYRSNASVSRYIDHLQIASQFRRRAPEMPRPDAVVVSMPCHHLAYEAVRYAVRRDIPVLLDIRDLWPDFFLSRLPGAALKKLGRLLLWWDFSLLRRQLRAADGILAVSESFLRWGLERAGRDAGKWDRVFYLGYKPAAAPSSSDALPTWLREREGQKLLVFIGTFGLTYEADLLVEAARRLAAAGRKDICFVLAGEGERSAQIREQARGLPNVVMTGWIGAEAINALMRRGWAGMLPYVSCAPQSIPNKPIEYLSAGLPVISSLEGELGDLIRAHGFGMTYRAGDLDGLCGCIEKLADDTRGREAMSAAALAFFKAKGDANLIYSDYASHIEMLVASRR